MGVAQTKRGVEVPEQFEGGIAVPGLVSWFECHPYVLWERLERGLQRKQIGPEVGWQLQQHWPELGAQPRRAVQQALDRLGRDL